MIEWLNSLQPAIILALLTLPIVIVLPVWAVYQYQRTVWDRAWSRITRAHGL